MVEALKGGMGSLACTSRASTRPWAALAGNRSLPTGSTCARMVAAASSTEIIVYVAMPASEAISYEPSAWGAP